MKEPVIITYPSANKMSTIYARIWEIENPKGIVQIVHGMAEHGGRYNDYARWLNAKGYLVCADDHAGHGLSIGDGIAGYMGKEDGWLCMIEDIDTLHHHMVTEYGTMPYFLLGHSMGSMLTGLYPFYMGHENLTSLILTGLPARNPLVHVAKLIARLSKPEKENKLLNKLAFGNFNKNIAAPQTEFDWVCSDPEVVKAYIQDPLCGFTFTSQGFLDLFTALQNISSSNWAATFPRDLPIAIFAGQEDPVAGYGDGAREYFHKLYRGHHKRCMFRMYPTLRHELLQETIKEEVYQDIFTWMERVLEFNQSLKEQQEQQVLQEPMPLLEEQ